MSFDLPAGFQTSFIVETGEVSQVDLAEAVKKALDAPLNSEKLEALAKRETKVALIVDDVTRPTPVSKIYPFILERLNEASEVKVIMALGLHGHPSRERLIGKLGEELAEKVIMHDPDHDLLSLGVTPQGTPVYINKLVVEADLRVALGTINPHPFAGYSGGPKILLPGVAGRVTIQHNHSLLYHPKASLGQLDSNPVYLDMFYAASKLPTFIVNVIPSLTEGCLGVVAGEAIEAHRKGAAEHTRHYMYNLTKPVDVAITTSYPADINFYQAWKGVFSVCHAVRKGGAVILASPCYEGMPIEKADVIKRYRLHELTLGELRKVVEEGLLPDYVFGLIYLKLRMDLEGKELVVVTDSMDEREVEALGFRYAPSIEDALRRLKSRMSNAGVLVNPYGAEVIIRAAGQ
ncbi:MAG: nickel-dependent lactate racemase [Thermoprotei archaeon]|nr:MAG: nickel-dependent lactate racemase [Thermoprotei archaeon]